MTGLFVLFYQVLRLSSDLVLNIIWCEGPPFLTVHGAKVQSISCLSISKIYMYAPFLYNQFSGMWKFVKCFKEKGVLFNIPPLLPADFPTLSATHFFCNRAMFYSEEKKHLLKYVLRNKFCQFYTMRFIACIYHMINRSMSTGLCILMYYVETCTLIFRNICFKFKNKINLKIVST